MTTTVLIKRFDQSIPLPEHKTDGAVAFDLSARIDMSCVPKGCTVIPLNVAIKPPDGFWILQVVRSSLHKRGLIPANGVGIIDSDYCGNDDEYVAILYNYTDKEVQISKGDRIAQALILPIHQTLITETSELPDKNRGGLGSTGHN